MRAEEVMRIGLCRPQVRGGCADVSRMDSLEAGRQEFERYRGLESGVWIAVCARPLCLFEFSAPALRWVPLRSAAFTHGMFHRVSGS